MENGIIGEISLLRGGGTFRVDSHNSNRYRLILHEDDGSRTAFCFSTPIYNQRSGKLIDYAFHQNGEGIYSIGSNSTITVSRDVLIENAEGYCRMSLEGFPNYSSDRDLRTGRGVLYPSSNGIVCRVRSSEGKPYRLHLSVGQPFLQIRENEKYFALLSEEFKPFVTVSCIGTVNGSCTVTAPAAITYQKRSDREYELTVKPCSSAGQEVLFEVNLYEPKLFQDTTVESANPGVNNAFGGTAFIGNTKAYGEQWLYTRLDFSKLPEMLDRRIIQSILHLPRLSASDVQMSAYGVSARFCSFGSNWDNKIPLAAFETDSHGNHGYTDLDITHLLTEQRTGFMKRSEGLIIRTSVKDSGFSAIATGDNYYTPQILEINFR